MDIPGTPPPAKKQKGLGAILSKIIKDPKADTTHVHPSEKAETEISRNLNLPRVDADSNPLEWWKQEQTHIPALATLEKIYIFRKTTIQQVWIHS